MRTYQDFLQTGQDEKKRQSFVRQAIAEYKSSTEYRGALTAEAYHRHENLSMRAYQKFLYTSIGQRVPDSISANWKMCNGFFPRFVLQEVQYLLGNGVSWGSETAKKKLGESFDAQLVKLAKKAIVQRVGYGFFNLDHVDIFGALEYLPLPDEENGAHRAGIRFWQIEESRPLRATLYEEDGYTDYIWRTRDTSSDKSVDDVILHPKRPYILKIKGTPADGERIYSGENYPTFPIVPLWGNPEHTLFFDGIREHIDAYDLLKAGFANKIDDTSEVYWILQNASGMEDSDLIHFRDALKTIGAAVVDDDGATAEPHTISIPYESREALLDRIKKDLYQDAMALDTENIASGAVTATQIEAAYEPLNEKCDDFESCVGDFIQGILRAAGIEGETFSFTRSAMVNRSEEVQNIVTAAPHLSEEYATRKILEILGDIDKAEEVLNAIKANEGERLGFTRQNQKKEDPEEPEETEEAPEEES